MGKHNARRTRRGAKSAAANRRASSREGYQASGTLDVSPSPAWHSAPPRCRLRITVVFSSLSCLRPPGISEWVNMLRIDDLLAQKLSRNGCIVPRRDGRRDRIHACWRPGRVHSRDIRVLRVPTPPWYSTSGTRQAPLTQF